MMTAAELKEIFESREFSRDLQELSSYLASIAPETPIVYCLAKHLWKRRHKFQVEKKRQDLVVDDKRIEFKSNYDWNMEGLAYELERNRDRPLDEALRNARENNLSTGWSVMHRVCEDICGKQPPTDMFVWTICSRDVSKLSDADRERICMCEQQLAYNKRHPYSDRTYLTIADGFLERLKPVRPFSVMKVEIETNGDFPCTYHFRICDFAPGNTGKEVVEARRRALRA
jgi:hypothetical protein